MKIDVQKLVVIIFRAFAAIKNSYRVIKSENLTPKKYDASKKLQNEEFPSYTAKAPSLIDHYETYV